MIATPSVLYRKPGIKGVREDEWTKHMLSVAGDFRPDSKGIPENITIHEANCTAKTRMASVLLNRYCIPCDQIRLICIAAGAADMTVA